MLAASLQQRRSAQRQHCNRGWLRNWLGWQVAGEGVVIDLGVAAPGVGNHLTVNHAPASSHIGVGGQQRTFKVVVADDGCASDVPQQIVLTEIVKSVSVVFESNVASCYIHQDGGTGGHVESNVTGTPKSVGVDREDVQASVGTVEIDGGVRLADGAIRGQVESGVGLLR